MSAHSVDIPHPVGIGEDKMEDAPEMTEQQSRALTRIDRNGRIEPADRELLPGIHWCWDWDLLPVFDGSPEKECCGCELRTTPNEA